MERVICAGCNRPVQPDEHLRVVQEHTENGPTKTYAACPDCHARVTGEPKAERIKNRQVPPDTIICGICDGLFHTTDSTHYHIRLTPADVAGTDVKAVEPASHYVCCQDCKEKFRPKIAARLAATNKEFQHAMLRASGMPAREAADLFAEPDKLKAKVGELKLDPLEFCQGGWLV